MIVGIFSIYQHSAFAGYQWIWPENPLKKATPRVASPSTKRLRGGDHNVQSSGVFGFHIDRTPHMQSEKRLGRSASRVGVRYYEISSLVEPPAVELGTRQKENRSEKRMLRLF